MSSNNIQQSPRSRQSSQSPRSQQSPRPPPSPRSQQSSRSPRSQQSPRPPPPPRSRQSQSPQSQHSQQSLNSLFGSDFSEEETRALDEAYFRIRAYRNQIHHDDKENKSPSPIRKVIQPIKTIKKKKTKNKTKISTLLHMRGGNKT